jgi:UDP-GlcNAc:undecaprenyl-phosphate GlcNAc-1-phosphate transferase
VLFVPLVIVSVPILDTTLVTVTRTLAGRAISQGGRDHCTHRLVALGMDERQVAVLLYAFSVLGGLVALGLTRVDRGLGILLGGVFLVALALLAAYLGRMRVYQSADGRYARQVTVLVGNLLYKRRLAAVFLDVVLLSLAYYGAYRLRFDGSLPVDYFGSFQSTLALVIAVKVAAFLAFGVYRGSWQYASILDLYRVVGAVVASSLLIFVYGQWQVPELRRSHSIIMIDALLTAALVLSSRLSFRSLEMIRQRLQSAGERVLVYGAGDGGELALRELLNNKELALQPVCFLDDDVRKHGAQVHGVPVVGGRESLGRAVERYGVRKIVIGTRKLAPEVILAVQAFAAERQLELVELDIRFKMVRAASEPAPTAATQAPLRSERAVGRVTPEHRVREPA